MIYWRNSDTDAVGSERLSDADTAVVEDLSGMLPIRRGENWQGVGPRFSPDRFLVP